MLEEEHWESNEDQILLDRRVGSEIAEGILNGLDFVPLLLGDFNAELILDGKNELDGVERIEAEVVEKMGLLGQNVGIDLVEVLDHGEQPLLDDSLAGRPSTAVLPPLRSQGQEISSLPRARGEDDGGGGGGSRVVGPEESGGDGWCQDRASASRGAEEECGASKALHLFGFVGVGGRQRKKKETSCQKNGPYFPADNFFPAPQTKKKKKKDKQS